MKENISISYPKGYINSGNAINAPEGCLISPSSNIIFTKEGLAVSRKFNKLISSVALEGGTRAFALDDGLVGLMGNNATTEKANGNLLLGSNKDLWFTGNNLANCVRVWDKFTSFLPIGGTKQIESVKINFSSTPLSGSATLDITVTSANLTSSPILVSTPITPADTTTTVAKKIADAMRGDSEIDESFYCYSLTDTVYLQDKTTRANDATLNIEITQSLPVGFTDITTSTDTQSGSIDYSADLSTTPQVCKYTGSGWNNPVQVGMAPEEGTPTVALTTTSTMGAEFSGIITGSTSVRVARKREGIISNASPKSEVVTGDGNSVYITIPLYTEDGSELEDREWVLYLTPLGRGSQDAHLMFPIYLKETVISGYEGDTYFESKGQAKIKLISASSTSQASRIVEVEYQENDLYLLNIFDDYYPLGASKFVQHMGNVSCGIGTGTNQTGFDVSYPNNRQAFPPTWRDWFREVPVSVSSSTEFGILWILGSYTTYQAIWTGATQETAPIIIKEISSKYGAIGEGASIAVNGVLYLVSKGKIPVRISPNGDIDDSFGKSVISHFSSFDDTTELGYDEELNTIFFIKGNSGIGFQIDNGIWTAPCTLTATDNVLSTFSMDGKMHYCGYNATDGIYTYKFDSDDNIANSITWNATSSFYVGNNGVNLKDIVEIRMIIHSPATDTLTIKSYRDFNNSSVYKTLFSHILTGTGTKITIRKLLESLDYESLALSVEGTKFRQTIYSILTTIDNHFIEPTQ